MTFGRATCRGLAARTYLIDRRVVEMNKHDQVMTNAAESIVASLEPVATDNPDGVVAIEKNSALGDDYLSTVEETEEQEAPADSYARDDYDEEGDTSFASYKKGKWPRRKEMLDLSVTVALNLPCGWPSPFLPPVLINHYVRHGPGPYASEALVIDEHSG